MGGRLFACALFCLLALPSAFGATIYGNVYDLSLEKVAGATIEVNTTPSQFFVAKDGTYSFDLSRGVYEITAQVGNGEAVASENRTITVMQDGEYVIDFILFPVIEDDDFGEVDFSAVVGRENTAGWIILWGMVFVVLCGAVYFLHYRKAPPKQSELKVEQEKAKQKGEYGDEYADQLMSVIRKHGGRTTQKEIRKELPLSEAKISLLIAELEHKGKIEKIKKG